MPLRPSLALSLLLAAALGCSSEAPSDTAPRDLGFGHPGSLTQASGRGSFRFGAASAATQIEDQNPATDWYTYTLPKDQGGLGRGTFVGDAAKGYTLALEDIQLMKQLGLDSYRFSIEWARVEPERDKTDEAALQHYSDFIDALLAAGIKPMITVFHFSNPIWVDDPRDPGCAQGPTDRNLCGWGHPTGGALVVEEFAEHARLLAERFGDRVDEWGTVNEPINYLLAAYGVAQFPPGKQKLFKMLEEFVPVVRDFIDGSAKAYAAIKAADTGDADGDGVAADVGMTLAVADWVPSRANQPSTEPEDVAARDRLVYVYHYLFAQSLLDGTFDANLDGEAEEQHPEWRGSLDWLGLQYYFRTGVTGAGGLVPVLNLTPCFSGFDFGSCVPALDKTHCVPAMHYEFHAEGLSKILLDYSKRFPSLPLVVTESGIATGVGARRAENVVRSLEQLAHAREAGVDVRGYYHWSLYDNFEWAEGYTPRFGLFTVDYEGGYTRTATEGADVYGRITRARAVSGAQRARYGGSGPMTPEGPIDEEQVFCR